MASDGSMAEARRVVLAHCPAFRIGRLRVDPGTRQIHDGEASETLEPRVMQVLVALAEANGRVVTRDELIALCWEGRIVTDDAINRVLSRLRLVAGGIGRGSFAVETIARVGYRLKRLEAEPVVLPFPGTPLPAAPVEATRGGVSRRMLIGGGAAAAVALAGGAGLLAWRPWQKQSPSEADQLAERGKLLVREGLPGQTAQAVAYFEKAVALEPDHADAWGALALAYTHRFEGFDAAELSSLPGRIRSAAGRALAVEPGHSDAELALIFIKPFYRNWAEQERRLTAAVERHPESWLARGRLGLLLQQMGRFEEALVRSRSALEVEPMLPVSHALIINALSALGRMQETESAIEFAQGRWPAHPGIWQMAYSHWLFNGLAERALALANDQARRPVHFTPELVARMVTQAETVAGGSAAARAALADQQAEAAARDVLATPSAARVLALLGRGDVALAALERYLLDRGSFGAAAPIGPYTRRSTDQLFSAPLIGLAREPAYRELLRATGLLAAWRESGSRPDAWPLISANGRQ